MSISQDAHGTWGGVIYMAVPFYKRARKIEGMFRPIVLRVAGCRIAYGYWGLVGAVQD